MRNRLEESLNEEGLLLLGVSPLDYSEDYDRFVTWLSEDRHGDLQYLEKYSDVRKNPSELLKGAKAALIVALPYHQGDEWPMAGSEAPRLAQYARFDDYHHFMKDKCLEALKRTLGSEFIDSEWRVVVDTAPVLERALAAKTAKGFIGKNTCFIDSRRGSFLLLGEVLTTREFPLDESSGMEGCGSCTLCQVECPTGALDTDYQIDSRKCLSYWTIEHRGTIPFEFWPWLSKYYFGCDICQLVCPYNGEADNSLPQKIPVRHNPSLFEIATMDQSSYEKYFGGTAATRAKRSGLIRNALIAMTVTSDPRLDEALSRAGRETECVIKDTLQQIRAYRAQSPSGGDDLLDSKFKKTAKLSEVVGFSPA